MPIKKWLTNFEYDPETFNAEQFKRDALKEFESDETGWNAAVSTRDQTIEKTAADLLKAQAKNWEMSQQIPVTKTEQVDPESDPTEIKFEDIFTPVKDK